MSSLMKRVKCNWWRLEFHRHTYIKSYNRLVEGKISILTRVLILFLLLRFLCLEGKDENLQRIIQHVWRLGTRPDSVAPKMIES